MHDDTAPSGSGAGARPGRRRLAVGLIASVIVVSGSVGLAVAAVPGSPSGLITACYVKSGANAGALRVIDLQSGATCKATEKPLHWDSKSATHPKGSNASQAFGTVSAGDNKLLATPAFVATANQTCVVISTLQVISVGVTANGSPYGYLHNLVSRNNTLSHDVAYGLYLVGTGADGYMPALTRSSVLAISAGQTIRFGAFLGSVQPGSPIIGSSYSVQTSYDCS